MPVYCISYDLIEPDKNYSKLYEKIKEYNHIRAVESTFFIISEDSASKIRDNLKQVLDNDDNIIVIEVVRNWASFITSEVNEWLGHKL